MFSIIGIVVVFGSIVAGYLMEHGNLKVLMQPAELIIIGGAAVGTVLTANPLHILKEIAGGLGGVFGSSKYGKQRYIESLKMMYELLNKARKEGLVALESDIEEPEKSALFSKYKDFVKNHHVSNFVCDTMRMAVSGGVEVFDLDQMLESDMEVHHHEARNRFRRSARWRIPCRDWGSWRRCWAWSSRWERWAVRRKKLDTKWRRRWWEHSWAFCCVTGWWVRWRHAWARSRKKSMLFCRCCGS